MTEPNDSIPRRVGRRRNYLESLRGDLQDLQGTRSLISELVQNADDAVGATRMRLEVTADALTVWNDGEFTRCADIFATECEWAGSTRPRCDFHSFRDVSGAAKRERDDTTGAFGIGFTSVYQITDHPTLISSGQRWEIDETRPEGEQIDGFAEPDTVGTTFRLPWARKQSAMRRGVGQEPVNDDLIGQICTDLLSVAPEALLFLRRLDEIEVAIDENTVAFLRDSDGEITTISGTDGSQQRWLMLTSSLGEEAKAFQDEHSAVIPEGRDPRVDVAVRIDDATAPGEYFVTLPTEELTGLPVSVNGSFFPKRDRKSILVDSSPRGQWNRAIIAEAATKLAGALEHVNALVDRHWIVGLLKSAHHLDESSIPQSAWHPSRLWWPQVQDELSNAHVVPTTDGALGTINSVLVWSEGEGDAAEVLKLIGIDLVAPDVRSDWYSLRSIGVGVQPLQLHHVTKALPAKPAEVLSDRMPQLWKLIDHLLATAQGSNRTGRSMLDGIDLIPLQDGGFGSARTAVQAPKGTDELLKRAGVSPAVTHKRFAVDFPTLAARVPMVDPARMLAWFSAAFLSNQVDSSFDRRDLLTWFAGRHDSSLAVDRAALAQLPIFPTGDGFRPLQGLKLPVPGFRDPIGVSVVIDLQGMPAVVTDFLRALDVPELDLAHFCLEVVPRAFEAGLDDDQVRRTLAFLAESLPRIEQTVDVRRALRDIPMIPCVDGVQRRGVDVYFGTVAELVVGPGRPIALEPGGGPAMHRLFEWLGVSARPRISDVLENCRTLVQVPANHGEIATAVVEHLDSVPEQRDQFDRLRNDRWLPTAGRNAAVRPKEVFTVFRQNIFRDQADFLDIPVRVQQRTRSTLEWLGVQSNPPPELVVKHLLACVESGQSVTKDVWDFLGQNDQHSALDRLRSRDCVPVGAGKHARPGLCFWDQHPFGRYRYQLSEAIRERQQLFEKLGVRNSPTVNDAVDVLGEVAVAHGGEQSELRFDAPIVEACWVFLDEHLRSGDATVDDLTELTRTECVLDAQRFLRRPDEVLFRDSSSIARVFGDNARARLIERPENMKTALDAAGVRHLREALHTQVLVRDPSPDGSPLLVLLRERADQLARAIGGVVRDPYTALDAFDSSVSVVALDRLVAADQLTIGSETIPGAELERCALWLRERSELLIVGDQITDRWGEVARELTLALGIAFEDLPQTAGAVKTVLAAGSVESAELDLDDLGFVEISEAIEVTVDHIEVGDITPADEPTDPDDAVAPDEEISDTSVEGSPQPSDSDSQSASNAGQSPSPSPWDGASPPATSNATAQKPTTTSGTHGNDRPNRASRTTTRRNERPRPRERLTSYVDPYGSTDSSDGDIDGSRRAEERRTAIDEAAIESVLSFERAAGRSPKEMPHENPGFDILSTDDEGEVRYIEVKGTKPEWDALGVGITSTQFEKARELREAYWLYVVVVQDSRVSEPYRIHDPASRISRYYFDHGWKSAADTSKLVVPLPTLPTLDEFSERKDAVPLISHTDGSQTELWVAVPEELKAGSLPSGAFAVQIAGESLGIGTRGGLAFARPLDTPSGQPDDDDLVVVRLKERLDPDSGEAVCIRHWCWEESADGERVGVRLDAHGNAAPISFEDPDLIELLGHVLHVARPLAD